MDKNKLILPISILLGCIILGGFYYASQLSKQQSIEKQQQIDLQAKAEQDKLKQSEEQLKTEREILEKCGNIAQQNYKAFQEEWNRGHNAKDYSHFYEISIHFNEELNLCVYEGGIAGTNRWERNIFNAYTNEVLAKFVKFDDSEWDDYHNNWHDEFKKKRAYYFEERTF